MFNDIVKGHCFWFGHWPKVSFQIPLDLASAITSILNIYKIYVCHSNSIWLNNICSYE